MEYANHLKEYAPAWSAAQVDEEVARIRKAAETRNHNTEVYKFCYSAIDLTTLSCNDSVKSVTEFARKAAEFYQKYPHIPNVASICIYPAFVETVGLAVDGTPMKITSVGGGFPAAQTFLEVKALEVAMAVENGADEVDIVLNVGRMLTGEYDEAANEVEVIRTGDGRRRGAEGDHRIGCAENPRADPQGFAAVDAGRGRFREDLDGQDRRGRNARGRRGDVPRDQDYYDKTGRKVGLQRPQAVSARPKTLHSTTPSSRRYSARVAHDGPVPHRRLLGRQQPPFRPSRARKSSTISGPQHDSERYSPEHSGEFFARLKYFPCPVVCTDRNLSKMKNTEIVLPHLRLHGMRTLCRSMPPRSPSAWPTTDNAASCKSPTPHAAADAAPAGSCRNKAIVIRKIEPRKTAPKHILRGALPIVLAWRSRCRGRRTPKHGRRSTTGKIFGLLVLFHLIFCHYKSGISEKQQQTMKRNLTFVLHAIGGIALLAAAVSAAMWLWNTLIPDIFGWETGRLLADVRAAGARPSVLAHWAFRLARTRHRACTVIGRTRTQNFVEFVQSGRKNPRDECPENNPSRLFGANTAKSAGSLHHSPGHPSRGGRGYSAGRVHALHVQTDALNPGGQVAALRSSRGPQPHHRPQPQTPRRADAADARAGRRKRIRQRNHGPADRREAVLPKWSTCGRIGLGGGRKGPRRTARRPARRVRTDRNGGIHLPGARRGHRNPVATLLAQALCGETLRRLAEIYEAFPHGLTSA